MSEPLTKADARVPDLIVAAHGAAGQFSAAAVLCRRASAMLERLAACPSEDLARATNHVLEDAGGLFVDGCWELKIPHSG
jgi:hypothetical protein